AGLDELAELLRALGDGADRRPDLSELLDRVADLLVEDLAIGDDDDRVEDALPLVLDVDELMGKPGDRVRLAAACRVLNQVARALARLADMCEQTPDHVELVVPRPDLDLTFLAGLLVLEGNDLRVVLEDVGEPGGREDPFP